MEEVSKKRKLKFELEQIELAESRLCPFLLEGKCERTGCNFIHGLQCDTCGLHLLIEGNIEQNEKHIKGK